MATTTPSATPRVATTPASNTNVRATEPGWNPSDRSTPTSRRRSRTARNMITPTPATAISSPAPTNCCMRVKNALFCATAVDTTRWTVSASAPFTTKSVADAPHRRVGMGGSDVET